MKVDPNAPAYPVSRSQGGERGECNGMPIRLELAARIMAGAIANDYLTYVGETDEHLAEKLSKLAITSADALIAAHNEGKT